METTRSPSAATTAEAETRRGDAAAGDLDTRPSDGPLDRPRELETVASGARLGRYIIIEPIGAGGMGHVYRAYDPKLSREIGLKLIQRQRTASDSDSEIRLLREAQAMAKLSHPNVLPVFDVDDTDHGLCLTMEFVPGTDLKAWLASERRPWRVVLDVFCQAGRGLHAAHGAGLVHRDFKPANVLLDEHTMRCRVMDFGLAKYASDRDPSLAPNPTATGTVLESTMTRAGTVMGTPAYMAPEVEAGHEADEASDQYSFCVSLHEAIYGYRPGHKPDSPDTTRSDAPSWLAGVIERGLAGDPSKRWPSMLVLVEQLERTPNRRRRRFAGLAGATLLMSTAAATAVVWNRQDTVCTSAADVLAPTWNPSRRQALTDRFLDGPQPIPRAVLTRVLSTIDDYAQAWVDGHTDACRATHVRKDQSDQMLDKRMACLATRRHELGAVLDIIEDGSRDGLDRAIELTSKLSPVAACSDGEALAAEVAPPTDPSTNAQVDEIRASLARVQALTWAGRGGQGSELAEQLLIESSALDYAPVRAEALVRRGDLHQASGQGELAKQRLEDAFFVGVEAGHFGPALEAATLLIKVHSYHLEDANAGLLWTRLATSLLPRTSEHTRAEAMLLKQSSLAYLKADRPDDARDAAMDSVGLIEEAVGLDHPLTGDFYAGAGYVLESTRDVEEARELYELALETHELVLGPDNPRVLGPLLNLAASLHRNGEHSLALTYSRRALDLIERSDQRDTDTAGTINVNTGLLLRALERNSEAESHFRRAVAIYRGRMERHPALGFALGALGHNLADMGRTEEAIDQLEAALELFRDADSGWYNQYPRTALKLAEVLWDQVLDRDRALALAHEAYALALPRNDPDEIEAVREWFGERALGEPG